MKYDEQSPIDLGEYRHRRRPRPTIPLPPGGGPAAALRRFITGVVADAIGEHEQRMHGRAS